MMCLPLLMSKVKIVVVVEDVQVKLRFGRVRVHRSDFMDCQKFVNSKIASYRHCAFSLS